MKTTVGNCGRSDCVHCDQHNNCINPNISIDKTGQCICYRQETKSEIKDKGF